LEIQKRPGNFFRVCEKLLIQMVFWAVKIIK